jgi:hypothetical protein
VLVLLLLIPGEGATKNEDTDNFLVTVVNG